MADGNDSLRDLQLKFAAMTEVKIEWYDQAKEALEKLKAVEDDVALQSTLREGAREDMDTRTAKIEKVQEQLAAKSAKLSPMLAENSEMTDK